MADWSSRRNRLPVILGACVILAACAAPTTPAAPATTTPATTAPATTTPATTTPATTAPATTAPAKTTTNGSAGGTTAPALPACTGGALPTVTDGVLTVGTGTPTAEPWFSGAPASGQGLESAVAYSVAQVLGYPVDQVAWVSVDKAGAAAGTATGFDLDVDQFTAADTGSPTADYSTGYFPVTDVLLIRAGSTAPTAAGLAAVKLGTTDSTPAGLAATNYPSEQQAVAALTAQAVDAVVLPIHTALATAQSDPAVTIAGQLRTDPEQQPQQFRALLPKGSTLTGCVSSAIDRLRVEGTLDALAQQWVTPSVPVLN